MSTLLVRLLGVDVGTEEKVEILVRQTEVSVEGLVVVVVHGGALPAQDERPWVDQQEDVVQLEAPAEGKAECAQVEATVLDHRARRAGVLIDDPCAPWYWQEQHYWDRQHVLLQHVCKK